MAVAGAGSLMIFLSLRTLVSVSGILQSPFGSGWWWVGLKGDVLFPNGQSRSVRCTAGIPKSPSACGCPPREGLCFRGSPKERTLEIPWEKTGAVNRIW